MNYIKDLWKNHKQGMSEDILYQSKKIDETSTYTDLIYNEALVKIEEICISINNKVLSELGMMSPDRNQLDIRNRDYIREKSFNREDLQIFLDKNKPKMSDEQRTVYDKIIHELNQQHGGLYFLDAPGGTGKTFLINLILTEVRIRNEIAVAVASSGIASTLIEGGRTAHSTFKLPLNLNQTEVPTCNINKNSSNLNLSILKYKICNENVFQIWEKYLKIVN